MSPLAEIRLVAARELLRTLRSGKGVALGALTLAGGLATALVCSWLEPAARPGSGTAAAQAYVEIKRRMILQATGDARLADYAAAIPTSLLVFLKITVWLLPLLVALLGFDVVAGDLQRRTIRFWTVRVRRSSIFVGKLVGLWALLGLVALALDALSGAIACARGYVTPGELVVWGPRFWLVVFVIAGAWAAITVFVSACFATPIAALLTTFTVFFVSWLAGAEAFAARVRHGAALGAPSLRAWPELLYPNSYDTLLLSPDPGRALGGVAILAAFVAGAGAAGAFVLSRRDV